MELFRPEFLNEDQRTMLNYITHLPYTERGAFFGSAQGQAMLKGLDLTPENQKSSKDASGATRKWDEAELEKLMQELRNASPDQTELILALVPGNVISVVISRLDNEKKSREAIQNEVHKSIQADFEKGIGTGLPGTGRRGPVAGTPGYQKWLMSIRLSRAAKKKPEVAKTAKGKKSKYKHFIETIKPGAKIKKREQQ